MRRLEKNIWTGWFTLIAVGVVFLIYEAFKIGVLIGILFLVSLLMGIALNKYHVWSRNRKEKIKTGGKQ